MNIFCWNLFRNNGLENVGSVGMIISVKVKVKLLWRSCMPFPCMKFLYSRFGTRKILRKENKKEK